MNKILLSFLFCFISLATKAQITKDILEGAKVAVEIMSLNKNNQETESECNSNTADFCIFNKMKETISVELKDKKSESEATMLIIPQEAQECTFEIEASIYQYKIINTKEKQGIFPKDQRKSNPSEPNYETRVNFSGST